ncbi:hypothetical protein IJG14_06965 [bacterium]|nr:hypothetical protein [bacterium]
MKKVSIFLSIFFMTALCASAHIDSNYMHSIQYLLNSGYSEAIAKYADITTRDPYSPTDDIYPEKSPKHFLKMLWKKIDSTAFPDDNNTWHSIKMNTDFSDLN